jgi:hypothetical protein
MGKITHCLTVLIAALLQRFSPLFSRALQRRSDICCSNPAPSALAIAPARAYLPLGPLDIALIVLVFSVWELAMSRLFFAVGLRDRHF